MSSMPIDHLPRSMSDQALRRRSDEIERRRAMFRQAKAVASALRTITDRQPGGQLTRAEAAILARIIRQNFCACVRKERHYRPTRAALAKHTGYSQRTVSKAIARLKEVGIIAVARYAKGGRLGDKGKGLATEFRSGCLQFIIEQLQALGYRLPKSLRDDLAGLARWAAAQVGEQTVMQSDAPKPKSKPKKPTGKLVPGTIVLKDRWSLKEEIAAPVAATDQPGREVDPDPPPAPPSSAVLCAEPDRAGLRSAAPSRPAAGSLSRLAMTQWWPNEPTAESVANPRHPLPLSKFPPDEPGAAPSKGLERAAWCRDPGAYDPEAWR